MVQTLPNFCPLRVDKIRHFTTYSLSRDLPCPLDFLLTHQPPLLVHVVIECPLRYAKICNFDFFLFCLDLMQKTVSPPAWGTKLWDLDPSENNSNNALLNEDLIVWMRTAAFPNFRKLYRKIEKTDNAPKLEKGIYKLSIEYSKLDLIT